MPPPAGATQKHRHFFTIATAAATSGISVELWQEIAADLGIETEFRETTTVTGQFDDLTPGRALDMSMGALTITPEREDRLDFTQPFYLSGLGVAVKTAPGVGAVGVARASARVEFLADRGRDCSCPWWSWRSLSGYWSTRATRRSFGGGGKVHRAIGSALWWTVATMTTVGYGDLAPGSLAGRLTGDHVDARQLISGVVVHRRDGFDPNRGTPGRGVWSFVVRGPDDLRRP